MLRVTLAGIRSHLSRLVSVTLATAIAVAFLAAALILNASIAATFRSTLGAEVQHADLIITPNSAAESVLESSLRPTLDQISATDGVAEVFAERQITGTVASGEYGGQYVSLAAVPAGALNTSTVTSGTLPTRSGEVAVDATLAQQIGLGLGSTLQVNPVAGSPGTGSSATVVGIVKPSASPMAAGTLRVIVPSAELDALSTAWYGVEPSITRVQVAVDDGASTAAVKQRIHDVLADSSLSTAELVDTDSYVSDQVDILSGGNNMLLTVLLVFVAIAMFVAALVITNTFSVLVAQRTKELALLRCIGASRQQVFRSVLVEAFAISLVAGVLGLLLAVGVMAGLVALSGPLTGSSVAVLGFNAGVFIWPVLVGVAVVLIAALGPARAATRVAPIAALRPAEPPQLTSRAGKARLVIGLLLTAGGAVLLAAGAFWVTGIGAVLLAIAGAIISSIGVFMLAVFFIPAAVGALGRLVGRFGVPAKLAGLNAVRNPRRTASTASALIIGVTLVTTVYTGAAITSETFQRTIDTHAPIDVTVRTWQTPTQELSDSFVGTLPLGTLDASALERIRAITGVEQVVNAPASAMNTDDRSWTVIAATPEQYRQVSRAGADELAQGYALVSDPATLPTSSVTLTGPKGTLTLDRLAAGAASDVLVVTPEQFATLGLSADEVGALALIRLNADLDTSAIVSVAQQISAIAPTSSIDGGALIRSMFQQIITVLLMVVSGLLAVAILIAVIGIGNTLSLSVIERTRENAMLRALGLTKRQLRSMLSMEALMVAAAAAVLGALLGIAYGYLGAASVLSVLGRPEWNIPWLAIAIVVVLASAAGLLSSVLPARRAARLSPIAGLAVE